MKKPQKVKETIKHYYREADGRFYPFGYKEYDVPFKEVIRYSPDQTKCSAHIYHYNGTPFTRCVYENTPPAKRPTQQIIHLPVDERGNHPPNGKYWVLKRDYWYDQYGDLIKSRSYKLNSDDIDFESYCRHTRNQYGDIVRTEAGSIDSKGNYLPPHSIIEHRITYHHDDV